MSDDDIIELNDIQEETFESHDDQDVILKSIDYEIQKVTKEIHVLQTKKQRLISKKEKLRDAIQQEKSAQLAKHDWERTDFPWSEELSSKCEALFGITKLRSHQLPTMNASLSGTDCILIMPTGGGKSLCYQLPALVSKGITLVVSPLISLMEDQLIGLRNRNIEARMLSASCTREQVNEVHTAMTDPNSPIKLLYVTPEKLSKSKRFMAKLQKMHQMGRFARLAIDEVHCCSQWGHDFRPDYKFLGIMRQMFTGTPILGLTATATSRVIIDVQKMLNIQGCLILKASFNRPNLFYEVHPKPSSQKECISELAKLLNGDFKGQSGIIYTMTVKDSAELAKELKAAGLRVAPYHAQLDPPVRSKIHRMWVDNQYQAVVATIAFGMGIDKPDVRFVIHHCISKSMENFYQESGRAGRDDKPARCIVFYRYADLSRQSTMVFTEQTGLENLYGLISYCIDSTRCRRNIIAEHFDERWEKSDCNRKCDHCKANRETKSVNLKEEGEQLIKLLTKAASLDQRVTGPKLVEIWLGKGPSNLRVKEATAVGKDKEVAEKIIAFLLIDGFLKEDFHFTPYSTISYIIPGPKAEAGLSPSSMIVRGRTKLEDLSTFASNHQDKNGIKDVDGESKNNLMKTHHVKSHTNRKETKGKSHSQKRRLTEKSTSDSSSAENVEKRKRIVTVEDSSDEC